MADSTNIKKYLDFEGLGIYDGKIKGYVDAKEEALNNEIAKVNTAATNNATAIGTVANLETTTKTDLVSAVNEVKGAVDSAAAAAAITVSNPTPGDGILKSYSIKQGDTEVAVINIPKDLVVKSGKVVKNPAGMEDGTYIELVLANDEDNPLYINVGTLVDLYTAEASAEKVQVAVDNDTRKISATIVAGAVGSEELAANAVTTAKIKDGDVTKAKLASDVKTSLEAADSAKGYTDEKFGALDTRVSVNETALGAGGSVETRIATAKDEAISAATSAAATDAQSKVDALANGTVKTNTDDIATLKGDMTTAKADIIAAQGAADAAADEIADLETFVGTFDDADYEATTVVGVIKEIEAEHAERIEAVESLVGSGFEAITETEIESLFTSAG